MPDSVLAYAPLLSPPFVALQRLLPSSAWVVRSVHYTGSVQAVVYTGSVQAVYTPVPGVEDSYLDSAGTVT